MASICRWSFNLPAGISTKGFNSGNVADQLLWESVVDPQVVGTGRTDPDPTILTLPDERFEGRSRARSREAIIRGVPESPRQQTGWAGSQYLRPVEFQMVLARSCLSLLSSFPLTKMLAYSLRLRKALAVKPVVEAFFTDQPTLPLHEEQIMQIERTYVPPKEEDDSREKGSLPGSNSVVLHGP
jgi:hypothetical protein